MILEQCVQASSRPAGQAVLEAMTLATERAMALVMEWAMVLATEWAMEWVMEWVKVWLTGKVKEGTVPNSTLLVMANVELLKILLRGLTKVPGVPVAFLCETEVQFLWVFGIQKAAAAFVVE